MIEPIATAAMDAIRHTGVLAGSLRRGCRDIGDIDIVLQGISMEDAIVSLEGIGCIVVDPRRPRVELRSPHGVPIDLWAPDPDRFGACLYHATGPGVYNTIMRRWALAHGMMLDLNGVHDLKTGTVLASLTEDDCMSALGVPVMPPEHRDRWIEWIDPWIDILEEIERENDIYSMR